MLLMEQDPDEIIARWLHALHRFQADDMTGVRAMDHKYTCLAALRSIHNGQERL